MYGETEGYLYDRYEHKPIWCNYTLKLNIAFFSALGSLVGGAKWEGKHRELQIFQGDGHF